MKKQLLSREDGFWSAVFLVIMVSLGTMALSSYYLMQKEMENTVNSTAAMQVDYSANGAAYYAIGAFRNSLLMNGQSQSIDVCGVNCDIFLNQYTIDGETNYYINVDGYNEQGVSRSIEIKLSNFIDFAGKAVNCEGEASDNLNARVQGGSVNNPNLIVENTPLPDIDTDALIAAANIIVTSTSQLIDGFPANMTTVCATNPFYQADCVTPNIIYIAPGVGLNLTGGGGWRTISGIFITDGDVDTNGGHTEINGVVYCTNPNSTVTMKGTHGGRYHIFGGVVSRGDVGGNGNPWIEHNRAYMDEFARFVESGPASAKLLSWKYL